ncbi:MAG: hypothetical protein GX591_20345, partial [Planctomycetes bacterium]|nr:hypothetical protein [Planctomycetota bacterium]
MGEPSLIGGVDVRVVGEMTQVRPAGPVAMEELLYGPGVDAVRVAGAANETISFQVIVDAGFAPLQGVRVRLGDLVGPSGHAVGTDAIELYRQAPVPAATPPWAVRLGREIPGGEVYDMLVPVDAPTGGEPFAVEAGGRLALWVDVPIARTTPAGRYVGALTVTAREDGRSVERNISVQLDVWDLVLPDTPPILALGAFDHRTLLAAFLQRGGEPFRPVWMDRSDPLVRQGLVLMRQLMTLARRHRLDLFDTALRPVFKRDETGAIRLHWDDYDAIVTPYLSGSAFDDRIGVAAWPAPWFDGWPDAANYGGVHTEEYLRTAEGLITRTVEHFRQIGHADRLVFYPIRTPPGPADFQRFAAMAAPIRRLAPDRPILSRLPLQAPEDSSIADLVDMAAPPGHWLDPSRAAAAGEGLAGAYLAPGDPPYVPPMDVLASPADLRAFGWLAMRGHLRGLFMPDVLGWDAAGADGTGLFYPGAAVGLVEVLPSIHLKHLRRGLEDAAWIRLLRQRGGEAAVERIVPMMARYMGLQAVGDHPLDARLDGWVADGPPWRLARLLLAAEVAAAGLEASAVDDTALARRLARRQLAEAAGTLVVERVATAAEAGLAPHPGGPLTVTVEIELFNPTTEAVTAALRLPQPPPGFTLIDPETSITVPPLGRAAAALRFACPLQSAAPAGKLTAPVLLEAPEQPSRA